MSSPQSTMDLLGEAWSDIQRGKAFSPWQRGQILGYVDRIVVLTSLFLILKLTWETIDNILDHRITVLVALLCIFHVQVSWLNFHHFLKFTKGTFNLFQVWLALVFATCLVFFTITLDGWVHGDDSRHHYIVNLVLFGVQAVFCFTLKVEGANAIYRVYHKVAPIFLFLWYAVSFGVSRISGLEEITSEWMVWVAPFFLALPMGAPKDEDEDDKCQESAIEEKHTKNDQFSEDGHDSSAIPQADNEEEKAGRPTAC